MKKMRLHEFTLEKIKQLKRARTLSKPSQLGKNFEKGGNGVLDREHGGYFYYDHVREDDEEIEYHTHVPKEKRFLSSRFFFKEGNKQKLLQGITVQHWPKQEIDLKFNSRIVGGMLLLPQVKLKLPKLETLLKGKYLLEKEREQERPNFAQWRAMGSFAKSLQKVFPQPKPTEEQTEEMKHYPKQKGVGSYAVISSPAIYSVKTLEGEKIAEFGLLYGKIDRLKIQREEHFEQLVKLFCSENGLLSLPKKKQVTTKPKFTHKVN